jgi:branched-chain amino acid transport system substrate-binding protein
LLTDATGLGASANKTSVQGMRAGVLLARRGGYNIKFVVADTMSNPSSALAAAHELVDRDHVLAVIAISGLTFAAAPYLTAHGIPVIGVAEDADEWQTAKNMFSVIGATHTNRVTTTMGKFFKQAGATTIGTLGYQISPASANAAKAGAKSAQAAGLGVGYVNAKFPLGSTDVQPVAAAMTSAGVDGFTATIEPNGAFALITAMRQGGKDLKVALLPDGYGGDLLTAGPGALQAAQNVYFALGFEPVEMQTPATKQFQQDLRAIGISQDPTYVEYNGYLSMGLLLRALEGVSGTPTHASLITSLSSIHDWNALGLFGSHHLDINDRQNVTAGADNCLWITKFVGSSFHVVAGADPICGTVIPGETVSPTS